MKTEFIIRRKADYQKVMVCATLSDAEWQIFHLLGQPGEYVIEERLVSAYRGRRIAEAL